jgi:hypothetical protein
METAVECRYRGRLIGWLVEGADGLLRYFKHEIVEENGHVRIVKRGWPGRDIQWTEYHA